MHSSEEKIHGMGFCIFIFTFTSSLPCLHTFWHAIPASFCFLVSDVNLSYRPKLKNISFKCNHNPELEMALTV